LPWNLHPVGHGLLLAEKGKVNRRRKKPKKQSGADHVHAAANFSD